MGIWFYQYELKGGGGNVQKFSKLSHTIQYENGGGGGVGIVPGMTSSIRSLWIAQGQDCSNKRVRTRDLFVYRSQVLYTERRQLLINFSRCGQYKNTIFSMKKCSTLYTRFCLNKNSWHFWIVCQINWNSFGRNFRISYKYPISPTQGLIYHIWK